MDASGILLIDKRLVFEKSLFFLPNHGIFSPMVMKLLVVFCLISFSFATYSPAYQWTLKGPTEQQKQEATRLYTAMESHIFNGEASNPDAGRHTLSAWCATHKSASGTCNSESKLCLFGFGRTKIKTVWDDRAGGYSRANIATLCKASILENIVQNARLADRSFMIQTTLKRPICVMHQTSGQGSCFPDGINFRKDKDKMGNVEIGQQCPRGGTGNTVDGRGREAVVKCPA